MLVEAMRSHDAVTENGALSHSTSGSKILDYFGKCGSYRGRTQESVDVDMAGIFGEDEAIALRVIFYNRLVTRKVNTTDGKTETVQRGQGAKDEFIKSVAWLELNRPAIIAENLWLVPHVGCFKDLWYDSAATGYYHYFDTSIVYPLVKEYLQHSQTRPLLAKYLPKIRSAKNERHKRLNKWARGLCAYLGWSERDYRKFKSNPQNQAHTLQRQMSANEWDNIDFNAIPGKAMFSMISRNGRDKLGAIERHGLTEKFKEWLLKQDTVKFTGYVYELYNAALKRNSSIKTMIYNAQFEHLLSLADSKTLKEKSILCALDTSGSMECGCYVGPRPIDICVSLGIYFSKFIDGAFQDNVVMFGDKSRMMSLTGTFCDRVDQIKNANTAWGSTNFQSVIDLLVGTRNRHPEIPVSEYPKTLLVVSDMQFNPVVGNVETNYEAAMKKLAAVGLPKMQIIWWNVNGGYGNDVPSKMSDEGTVLISGFDPSIITLIAGGEVEKVDSRGETVKVQLSPYEQMLHALDQDILMETTI